LVFQDAATWLGYSAGSGIGNFTVETTFPKGRDFHDALGDAGLLAGQTLSLVGVADSVSTVNVPARAWVEDTSNNAKYLSFTTPVGGACGKVGFADIHAGGAPSGSVPASCPTGALSVQERALELLFFDLSACVSDDSMAAPPPPPSQ
jgi:hypothetical protein